MWVKACSAFSPSIPPICWTIMLDSCSGRRRMVEPLNGWSRIHSVIVVNQGPGGRHRRCAQWGQLFSKNAQICMMLYLSFCTLHDLTRFFFMLWKYLVDLGCKVENILKSRLVLIPSPSPLVKIQIMGGKVCLWCKGKSLLGVVNKLLNTKSLLTSITSNVLPYYLK